MSNKVKAPDQLNADLAVQAQEAQALMQAQIMANRPELSTLAQDAPNLSSSAYLDERKGHPSREIESRNMASRDNDAMIKHYMDIFKEGSKGKTYFEKEIVPPGYVYGCKAVSVLNRPLPSNVLEAHRKGWRYVPIDRHPQLISDTSKNYVEIEGLAYMERPEVIHNLEAETFNNEGRKQQQHMDRYVTQDAMAPLQMQPGSNYKPIEGYSYSLKDADMGGYQNAAQASGYGHMHGQPGMPPQGGHHGMPQQGNYAPQPSAYVPPAGGYNHY